jgi:hypothetical protein
MSEERDRKVIESIGGKMGTSYEKIRKLPKELVEGIVSTINISDN